MKTAKYTPLLALFFGMLPSLPLLFPCLYPLAFLLSVPVLLLFFSLLFGNSPASPLRFTALGFLSMLGYFLIGLSFLRGMYPLSFINGVTEWEAFYIVGLSWILLTLLQSLLFSPAFLLFYFTVKLPIVKRHMFFLVPLLYAALYTVFEWAQNFTWLGVPFSGLSLGQTENKWLLQTASLFGAHYISFVVVLVNALLAMGIFLMAKAAPKPARFWQSLTALPKQSGASLLLAVLLLSLNLLTGGILYALPEDTGDSITIGIIQVNHDALDKDKVSSYEIWEDASRLADDAIGEGASLLLYSETLLTVHLPSHSLCDEATALSKENGVSQLIGGFYREISDGEKITYNSLYYIDDTGTLSDTRYDKRHLVPFGEYLPMSDFFELCMPWVCDLMLNSLSPGNTVTVIPTEDYGKIGALICFDSIYSSLTRESVRDGARFLVLSTNDSWFTGTQAIHQHLGHAALRAVESGRYVARSAATGSSALIDTKGNYVVLAEEGVSASLTADLKTQSHMTLYTRIGDAFPLLCLGFPLVLLLISSIRKKER